MRYDTTTVATFLDGDNLELAFSNDFFERLKYFANCPDGNVVHDKDGHKLKLCIIGWACAQKNASTLEKQDAKFTACAENYKGVIADLKDYDMLSDGVERMLKKDLKNMKLTGRQVREFAGYPPGEHLWTKYKDIKKRLINDLLPHCKEKKDWESGKGLRDMWGAVMMVLFKVSKHYVSVEGAMMRHTS
jgi:hypothetical protein